MLGDHATLQLDVFHDMRGWPALDGPGIGGSVARADARDGIDGQAAV